VSKFELFLLQIATKLLQLGLLEWVYTAIKTQQRSI